MAVFPIVYSCSCNCLVFVNSRQALCIFHYIRFFDDGVTAHPEIKLRFVPPGLRDQKWLSFIDPSLSGYRAHWRSLKNKQDAKVSFYWSDVELVNLFAVGLWVMNVLDVLYCAHVHVKVGGLGSARYIIFWCFSHGYHSVGQIWNAGPGS